MKRLPVRPRPAPYEPLNGYFHRLAVVNGYDHPHKLWRILSQGQSDAARVLAFAIDLPELPVFSAPSPRWLSLEVENYGLASAHFNHHHFRHCPACIAEAPYFKPVWSLNMAVSCSKHGCWLASGFPIFFRDGNASQCAVTDEKDTYDAPPIVVALGKMLESALDASVGPFHPALPMFQQALTADQTIKLVRFLGGLADGQITDRSGQMAHAYILKTARAKVVNASLLLTNWPNTFFGVLDQMMAGTSELTSIRHVFGRLYHVLYKEFNDAAFNFLRDAFEFYLKDNWRGELSRRNRNLAEELIVQQQRISPTRAHRELGVKPSALRYMLAKGMLKTAVKQRKGKREFITLDMREVLYVGGQDVFLDLRATAKLFGVGPRRIRELVMGRVLPVYASASDATDRRWKFKREDIDAFIDKLRMKSLSEKGFNQPVFLSHALRYWRIDSIDWCALVRAIVTGDLPFLGRQPLKLSELIFEKDILRKWLIDRSDNLGELLSIHQASKVLGIKEQVVYELVANKVIASEIGSNNGRCFRGITPANLAQFHCDYISLAELAREQGTLAVHLMRKLTVKPVTGPSVDGCRQYFYRKSELNFLGKYTLISSDS